MSKDYKVKYKDVYIFAHITQYILRQELLQEIETPYRDEDGTHIHLRIRTDSVRGYGRRQWQRDDLERKRGMVISIEAGGEPKLIGLYKAHKGIVELFVTGTLGDIRDEIVKDVLSHLTYNNVNIEVSTDESKRIKAEKRWRAGDRIQREGGLSGYRDESDYADD